jgi:hypothetical protein
MTSCAKKGLGGDLTGNPSGPLMSAMGRNWTLVDRARSRHQAPIGGVLDNFLGDVLLQLGHGPNHMCAIGAPDDGIILHPMTKVEAIPTAFGASELDADAARYISIATFRLRMPAAALQSVTGSRNRPPA